MASFHFPPTYENWVPLIARIVFGLMFLMGATFKIPGTENFAFQVAASAAVGIPFPLIAVTLAFILEVAGGVALIIGWQTRTFALLLAGFVVLIALFFYRNLSDQATFASFMSCITEIAGLAYISVYGAQYLAVAKDPLPQHARRG
jgi:putative oxidoreductase